MLDFMNCIEENDKDRVQEEIYLAPHEQNLFDAMDSINEDSDAIMTILAANAQCKIISGQDPDDIMIKSGPCIGKIYFLYTAYIMGVLIICIICIFTHSIISSFSYSKMCGVAGPTT